ncbi:hypothetical protein FJ803_19360 [Escherichia coli]|nr:TA system toxin CbtA family protein [Escherichia coli]EEW1842529.1 hypothetical protein [Escherichia coli]EFB1506774.1 hypothetical protein [Escherichia coli]MXD65123.1 hypothetical protein [Escherichia coli]HAW0258366.1 hypothetical protein [Escherichia coli]HAY4134269.1 hypothetical protein [Escherichia coli]
MKKNKYSTPLWVLATILAGMLSPMQSAVNGQLGHWLQDGNACAVTRSQLINSIDILRARRATGLMTRDNYRTVNNITLGKYPEAK